jgi:5-methyltetrahydropteroyltriglutamate--homocysteine methyltransferase
MSVARFGKQKKENELTEIRAYAPGIYARSEELVQATRDLNRGRVTEEAVEEQRLADLCAIIEAQREAGLDYFSDGLLNWQNIFRPFDESAQGLRPVSDTTFCRYFAGALGAARSGSG